MRKLYIFGLIGLAAVLIGLAWADQMTFTTYYPAPYGVYKEMATDLLQLVPQPGHPDLSGLSEAEKAEWEGKIYYNGTSAAMYYYDGSNWLPLGRGGLGLPDYDSGWVSVPEPEMNQPPLPEDYFDFEHFLGTTNYIVYLEGQTATGEIHNAAIGGELDTPITGTTPYAPVGYYSKGVSWVNKTADKVIISRGFSDDGDDCVNPHPYDKVRVRLWKIE